jgi:hypothetical protein
MIPFNELQDCEKVLVWLRLAELPQRMREPEWIATVLFDGQIDRAMDALRECEERGLAKKEGPRGE